MPPAPAGWSNSTRPAVCSGRRPSPARRLWPHVADDLADPSARSRTARLRHAARAFPTGAGTDPGSTCLEKAETWALTPDARGSRLEVPSSGGRSLLSLACRGHHLMASPSARLATLSASASTFSSGTPDCKGRRPTMTDQIGKNSPTRGSSGAPCSGRPQRHEVRACCVRRHPGHPLCAGDARGPLTKNDAEGAVESSPPAAEASGLEGGGP